jgi:glycosyltransferase involved in cell wall biosynthesis
VKIAILSRNFDARGGGAERYAFEVASYLAQEHEVHVFAQSFGDPVPGVSYHQLSFSIRRPRWLNQLGFALESWLKTRHGFDAIHSHENTWHGHVQTVHVVPVRSSLLLGKSGWQKFFRWLKISISLRLVTYLCLEKSRFRVASGRFVVAVSRPLADTIEKSYPDTKRSLKTITPGVHLPNEMMGMTRRQARLELKLPLDDRIALFVANDPRRKGLDTILQAMAMATGKWCLAVAGASHQYATYQQMATSLGLGDRVFFLGSLQNISNAYKAAETLLHPTWEDTFAMVVLEAMAHRLPVIVSDAPYCGISEMLTHQKDALILSNPADAAQIAEFLNVLASSPELADSLRENGFAMAAAHDWQVVAQSYEALFLACTPNKAVVTQ